MTKISAKFFIFFFERDRERERSFYLCKVEWDLAVTVTSSIVLVQIDLFLNFWWYETIYNSFYYFQFKKKSQCPWNFTHINLPLSTLVSVHKANCQNKIVHTANNYKLSSISVYIYSTPQIYFKYKRIQYEMVTNYL